MRTLALILCLSLAGCQERPDLKYVTLSYSEKNTFCLGCPSFRVDFSEGGHVNFEGLSGCAVPGEQHHTVPEQHFREMVQAFHDANFFSIPRIDPTRIIADAPVFRLTYRDDRRIHEVVDVERNIPRIKELEHRVKAATEVGRYLKPSVALYTQLLNAGWDVNTLGSDRQNALFAAVVAGDLDAVKLLLQHGSKVTDQTIEFASATAKPEILRLLTQRKGGPPTTK